MPIKCCEIWFVNYSGYKGSDSGQFFYADTHARKVYFDTFYDAALGYHSYYL